MRAFLKILVLSLATVAAITFFHRPANADPSFGTDMASGLPPADIFEPGVGVPAWSAGPGPALPAPASVIPGGPLGLGIPAGVDVDAISYGNDLFPPPGPWHLVFTVGAGAIGNPGAPITGGPNVFMETSAGGDGTAQGDIWSSMNVATPPTGGFAGAVACGFNSNRQLADEDGVEPVGYPRPLGLGLPAAAHIDSFDMSDNSAVDAVAPFGVPEVPIFFSVSAATAFAMGPVAGPGLALPAAVSGADVLVWQPPPAFPAIRKWATAAMLGLIAPDDIDALTEDYTGAPPIFPGWPGGGNPMLISLAPGSPSLGALGTPCTPPGSATGGDVFAEFAIGGPAIPALAAEQLGLGGGPRSGTPMDNLTDFDIVLESGVDTDGDFLDNAVDFDDDADGCADMGEVAKGLSPLAYIKSDFTDADSSKKVQVGDFSLLLAAWNATPLSVNWDPRVNFDKTLPAKINSLDFSRLLAAWNRTCP